jgi:hypothetical protein
MAARQRANWDGPNKDEAYQCLHGREFNERCPAEARIAELETANDERAQWHEWDVDELRQRAEKADVRIARIANTLGVSVDCDIARRIKELDQGWIELHEKDVTRAEQAEREREEARERAEKRDRIAELERELFATQCQQKADDQRASRHFERAEKAEARIAATLRLVRAGASGDPWRWIEIEDALKGKVAVAERKER